MKHFVTILALAGALMLTSCNNFLDVKNVKKEIEDVIAYNNAKTINVLISCKEEMGSVLPSQTIQAKLGYDFDIQFIPNTQNYIIQDPTKIFEAVSWKDNSIRRDDCVEFKVLDQSLDDKKAGLYRVKAKVTKDFDDIQIQPKCTMLPSIVSVSPTPDSTEYNANTTIIITVNTPLENEAGEGIKIPYGENGIKVKYGSIDMKDYFELPVLSSDHTKIIIQPKGDKLLPYLQNVPYVDITFSFSPDFKFALHGSDIYFAQNEKSSFTMKFNKSEEKTLPKVYGLFASRSELHASEVPSYNANDFFVVQELDAFDTADDIRKNRVSSSVYISGRAYDLESGISRIEVTEQRIKDNDARNTTDAPKYSVIFTREDADFLADENGNTYFSLYFPFKSENGAIKITVTAYDGCGNHDSKSFVVFKKVFDENTANKFTVKNGMLIDKLYNTNYKTDEETIKKWIKRIHINPGINSVKLYELTINGEKKPVTMPPSVLKYELIMNGTTQSLPYKVYTTNDLEMNYFTDSNIKDFFGYFDLPVEKVSGVSFVFKFSDDMGNSFEKSYSIMNVDDIGYRMLRTINEDGSYQVYSYYKPGITSDLQKERVENIFLCDTFDEEGNPKKQFTETCLPNKDYWCISTLGSFYTDFSDFVLRTQPFENVQTIEEIDYEIADELTVDKLATIQVSITLKNSDIDFDYIYLSYFISAGSTTNSIYFPEHSLTHSFTIDPVLINGNSIRILVRTVKDGLCSAFKEKYLNSENIFYPALDTKVPSSGLSRPRYDYVLFTATDDNPEQKPTGYIEMNKTGNKYYLENGEKQIPIWEFDLGDNYYSVNISDGRNVLCKTNNFRLDSDSEIMRNIRINYHSGRYNRLDAGWIFESTDFDSSFSDNYMYGDFYKFDSNDKSWTALLESTTSNTGIYTSYVKSVNGIKTNEYVRINKPTDLIEHYGSFVKMTTYYYWSGKSFWPAPFYFYADSSKRNTGNYDYIQTHSNTIFFVVSDAPTLVQTIAANTSDSYEDCKNWTAYEWLSHNKVVDEKQYDFAHVENPTPKKYEISSDVLNQIKTNECYCVIAHFADGSTYVSDVFKKE